jgi:hypothetical protein
MQPGQRGNREGQASAGGFELPQLPQYAPASAAAAPAAGASAAGIVTAPVANPRSNAPNQPSMPAPEREAEAAGPRAPSLTQQMRMMQPPDVARQAMSELGVLARELATLPELLEVSGLARTHSRSYFDATQAYLGLARQAWESVAEERLEQSGAEPEYRQRAIAVARRVGQMQQESRAVTENPDFQLPRKTPFLWMRRVVLVRAGLRAWQERLAPTPDLREMGRGLFLLRGYLSLAGGGRFELMLLDLMTSGALVLVGLLGVSLLLLLGATLATGSALTATGLFVATLATVLAWVLVLVFTLKGPVPLGTLLGASVFSPGHSTRHGRNGSPLVTALLRTWWLLIGVVSALALLAALALGGALAAVREPFPAVSDPAQALSLAGSLLALTIAPAAAVSVAALLLLALPVTVITLVRFAAELAGGPAWVPAARRHALSPALLLLAPATSVLVIGAWLSATALGWERFMVVALNIGPVHTTLTLRAVALFLVLVLPYLLLLDLPYRIGIGRWRRAWRSDLATRRADVESHVRRLSVADPRSGAQDTSEENLRAMQYDLVLLQFYRDKIEEAHRASGAPFALSGSLVALAVAVVGALLLDSVNSTLGALLFTPR